MSEKFVEKIFSVKNDKNRKHKVVKVLGAKIKFKKINLKQKIEYFKVMHDKSLYVGIPDDITLQMSFNSDCNCKCKFCKESISKSKEDREIIPDKWLYEYFLPLYPKVSHIVPTYGEITACREGYEYLSFISKNYPHINVFMESNGIAFNDKWAKLASENLINTHFSINAINAEYFKKTVWEKDGVYELIQNNLNSYMELLKEKGLFAFKPSVSCVLNSTNYETMTDFLKQYIGRGIQYINFYFDYIENQTGNINIADEEKNQLALKTFMSLIEIERVLKGKVHLFYRLYVPTNKLKEYDDKVAAMDINELNEKYADILELAKDMDLKQLSIERSEIRKKYGKRHYTYYEDLTGCTFHQRVVNGLSICTNPWSHIRLRPNGNYNYCSWIPYFHNLKDHIENDHIDWDKFFNSYYYRLARKNFQNHCYCNCMPKCPGFESINQEEFDKKYSI